MAIAGSVPSRIQAALDIPFAQGQNLSLFSKAANRGDSQDTLPRPAGLNLGAWNVAELRQLVVLEEGIQLLGILRNSSSI